MTQERDSLAGFNLSDFLSSLDTALHEGGMIDAAFEKPESAEDFRLSLFAYQARLLYRYFVTRPIPEGDVAEQAAKFKRRFETDRASDLADERLSPHRRKLVEDTDLESLAQFAGQQHFSNARSAGYQPDSSYRAAVFRREARMWSNIASVTQAATRIKD